MTKEDVLLFDLEGNFLQKFSNKTDCATCIGATLSNVCQVILGAKLQTNGFQIRIHSNKVNPFRIGDITGRRSDTIPIAKYWNDNLICVYNSLTDASVKNNVNIGRISKSIKNGTKCNGFNFKNI